MQKSSEYARGAVTTVLIVDGAARELRTLWVFEKEDTDALAVFEEPGWVDMGDG